MATADEWYDQWKYDWELAQSSLVTANERHDAYIGMPKTTFPEVAAAMNQTHNVQSAILAVFYRMLDYSMLYGHLTTLLFRLAYFYDHPPGNGEEYELTAGKIMAAWIDADKDSRLMTVLTLDELRREAWTEQFTSYKIAAPGGG